MKNEIRLYVFPVLIFLCFLSNAGAWETVTLPSQTAVVKEEEMSLNGQARKYLYCRTSLSYPEIKDFFQRFLPGLGWRTDCPDCQKQKGDISLNFIRGGNKASIIFPDIHSVEGKNDFLIVMTDIKNEAAASKSTPKEGEDYPGKDISSIPRYPKSQRVAAIERTSSKKITLAYQTGDSIDEVLDFYYQNISKYGWELKKELDFKDFNNQAKDLFNKQPKIKKLEGGALVLESSFGKCMITVTEHPREDINLRVIGINYESK